MAFSLEPKLAFSTCPAVAISPGPEQYANGVTISIDCITVENTIPRNRYERAELDYLVYNDPAAYADLILSGEAEDYLKAVTEYKPLD